MIFPHILRSITFHETEDGDWYSSDNKSIRDSGLPNIFYYICLQDGDITLQQESSDFIYHLRKHGSRITFTLSSKHLL